MRLMFMFFVTCIAAVWPTTTLCAETTQGQMAVDADKEVLNTIKFVRKGPGSTMKIVLINGKRASEEEISALRTSQVEKINIIPGNSPQVKPYGAEGALGIIDVIMRH